MSEVKQAFWIGYIYSMVVYLTIVIADPWTVELAIVIVTFWFVYHYIERLQAKYE